MSGERDEQTFRAASNLALVLSRSREHQVEAKELLRKVIPLSRRVQGEDHFYTLKMQWTYGDVLSSAPGATREDCLEAEKILEKVFGRYKRMLGENHPYTKTCESQLASARMMARMRSQFG